ncbi:MAG: porphobilinogen synthase [Nitrososphaeraceae archaeon]
MQYNDSYYSDFSSYFNIRKTDLIYPLFVHENTNYKEIEYMPELYKIPLSKLEDEIEKILNLGIKSVILFGIPKSRNKFGTSSFSTNGVIQKSLKIIRKNFGNKISLFTDVCLCQYNHSGHCGISRSNTTIVDNDLTLTYLSKIAISHAISGADVVAPSSMMDGQVKFIRSKLDDAGFKNIKILSFSAKHSSSLYKPFRFNAFYQSNKVKFDKSSYQISCSNPNQLLREIDYDRIESADMVMIKPALFYLDMIYRIKNSCNLPLVVQIVSGEYCMIKALSEIRNIDEIYLTLSMIKDLKRAGANKIISYSSLKLSPFLLN